MKICILANALSVHTQRWAKAFAEKGHEVHLLSIRHIEISGITVHTVNVGNVNSGSVFFTFLSYIYLLLTAKRALKKLKPDIVIAYYTITYGVIAAFADYHPFVVSIMGSDVIYCAKGLSTVIKGWLTRYALKKADMICSTSRFMIDRTVDLRPATVPIKHIPFGVDYELFRPVVRQETKESEKGFLIGFVKALSPKYAPDILISAMPEICRQLPDARLVIIGQGPMKAQLQNMARELGIMDKVEFTGFIPNEKLPVFFNSFDVFVHPSICQESFGVSILEASACGCPVVATRVGGVPEVCIDGQTGILIEPNNPDVLAEAIIKLAKNPELRNNIGRAGRDFVVKNYYWKENVQTMLETLQKTVSEYRK
ncbi:MAG: glycosyltransferase family 4 protein [Planctomycetes bacterium]|nr:glycosyltransferase family 4 protein [Planctomycetota bacterium]MBU1518500.1 glycosyltransferase family 4 protein [Planctomycetota bacterium]MBU2457970.1 glycosyltransferase family 4 protein [Planctomycetota bacterium]MBU2597313.1 glycosyltransferase family 4 protein [Planctomycetota bacterium]